MDVAILLDKQMGIKQFKEKKLAFSVQIFSPFTLVKVTYYRAKFWQNEKKSYDCKLSLGGAVV